jgi:hypothetical protein
LSWLNHPKFLKPRNETLDQFKAKEFNFRKVKPVIFLCGGLGSKRREKLSQFLKKNHPETLVFYADNVWPFIAAQSKLNALEMEAQLAYLADMVLIVVESPGTFAELGAFSLSDPLRKKLLPIIDIQYRGSESFINTGPVRWIDKDSDFKRTLWVDHTKILEIVDELKDRLSRLPKATNVRIPNLSESPKHLLFFICDLISVFGPVPLKHIEFYIEQIMGKAPTPSCLTLLELARAMDLIKIVTSPSGIVMYYRPLDEGQLSSFQNKRYLYLPSLRARIISVLLTIDAARAVLQSTGSDSLCPS